MKCPRCQAENLDERVYCWKCFAPLRSGAMGTSPTVTATAPAALPRGRATEAATTRKPPLALLALTGALVIVAVAVIAFLLFRNSPSQVAQTLADGLVRKDEATLRRIVAAKDADRVPRLLGFAGMFPDLQLQVVRVEDRGGQKVAVLSASFSQVAFGAMRISVPNSKVELPFALTRERGFFWRVDLEQSENLLLQQLQQAAAAYLRQSPAMLQKFLQQMMQGMPAPPR
ncbi:MAG: hypothetical protein PVTTEEND_001466 [Candidatus Fervidibacter sp.]|mgnify:CR=1 FL=1|jgi:hypothetical protein